MKVGILLFKKKKSNINISEYNDVLSFNQIVTNLLAQDKFIAKSEYYYLIDKYKQAYDFFYNTNKSDLLFTYCKKNKLDKKEILKFIDHYASFKNVKASPTIIKEHNDEYIHFHLTQDKEYLDNILKKVDPNILLDNEQRKVILSDEDYSLVIAGAGTGKTTTVAAKVKYLVEKKKINPKEILVISFTNKAVGELKEKINEALKIDCPITTFHSSGYAILRKQENEKKKIVSDSRLFYVVNDYLKNNILTQPEMVSKLIDFFGNYFDLPYEGNDINAFFSIIASKDYSTLKSNIGDYSKVIIDKKTRRLQTIRNETVRSAQEVQIANFLYLNGIDYEYEPIYPYHILKAKKPYTPDFVIKQGNNIAYIEHFGITEYGTHSFYTKEELKKYKEEIIDKIKIHKKHNTNLIFTYSAYSDGNDLISHLKEKLILNNFKLNEISKVEVFSKLIHTEENKYILKFIKLMCVFISNFKTDGYDFDDFYRMQRYANVRSKLFLDIAKECYLEYQKQLSLENAIDFQDMINDSARILREKSISKEKLGFKYIIVDEYQDISRQRFDLTRELSNLCDAKIIAVGDDWQSIYAFSGSDVSLFTHFSEKFGYADELKITKTYRNAQEVIDIAGNFVQKNDVQIKKTLVSPKRISKPIIIYTYDEKVDRKLTNGKGGKYYNLGKIIEKQIGEILETNKKEGKSLLSSILLIGRFGFDARNMCFSNDFVYDEKNGKIFSKKYPYAKLEFLTAHSSKGLGYDNVILINARNELYGFPSKIEDDPVLRYVTKFDTSMDYAEERRLFYVALTRTKNRVYIATPENYPSEFILELIDDYPDITLIGNINKNSQTNVGKIKKCPICGFPLQLKWNKNYGMKLWICTNEPEICNYITNEIGGKELSIQKCDECKDGYLIVKSKNDDFFLGCSNYRVDGTGCDRTMSREYYHKWLKNGFEEDVSINKPTYARYEISDSVPLPKNSKITDVKVENVVEDEIKERKYAQVHRTQTKLRTIEKDGFEIIVDDEENILTNMELLKFLRKKRNSIAAKLGVPAYAVISNKGLVSLATYKPETKEEFIKLYGLGEKTYQSYGADMINYMKQFFELDKDKEK